jgi:hypothetical protein
MLMMGFWLVAVIMASTAQGIPPPWAIEEMKITQSTLILIGEVTSVAAAGHDAMDTAKASVNVLKLLKGNEADLPRPREAGNLCCQVTFAMPEKRQSPAGIERAPMGGPASPDVRTNDIALMFLQAGAQTGDVCRIVLGSFGYMKLNPDSAAEKTALQQRIQRQLQWSGRIEAAGARESLESVYRETMLFLRGRN